MLVMPGMVMLEGATLAASLQPAFAAAIAGLASMVKTAKRDRTKRIEQAA